MSAEAQRRAPRATAQRCVVEKTAKAAAFDYAALIVGPSCEHQGRNLREEFELLARICRQEVEAAEEVLGNTCQPRGGEV